eukprot:gene11457-11603_t
MGSTVNVVQPALCADLDGVPLTCGAAGMAHTAVVSGDGAVYGFGWGNHGQLGVVQPPTLALGKTSTAAGPAEASGLTKATESLAARAPKAAGSDCLKPSTARFARQQQQQWQPEPSLEQELHSSPVPVLVEQQQLDDEHVVKASEGRKHLPARDI